MSGSIARTNIPQRLYYMPKITRWSKGIGAALPEEYKKFWKEWKLQTPQPVHYIKQEGSYIRDENTGEVRPVQNVPLTLKYPKEIHDGIWGGEAVVQGFIQRHKYQRRIPHFWVPTLKSSVVYSEVLDSYMKVIVTNRTLDLIHKNYGFDYYLLNTQACDLVSVLALKIKRQILISLADKTLYPNDEVKREEIYEKYKKYLSAYTREEIEWYGLPYSEACKKYKEICKGKKKIVPLKIQYRLELIEKLKQYGIDEVVPKVIPEERSSWLKKINPFS